MSPTLKNVIAVVVGLLVGGGINLAILKIGGMLAPLPEGVNPDDVESIKAHIHLYQPIHFVFPLLAHAFNALVSGFLAAFLAATHKMRIGMVVGSVPLIGGIIMAVFLEGNPLWFFAIDLPLAYVPMAYLGTKLGIMWSGNATT